MMKISIKKLSVMTSFLLATSVAHAQLNFNSLSQSDVDEATKEFSHNFMFSSVSGASSLGSIWGFEVGLIGGTDNSPKLDEIVKRTDPAADFKNMYDAALLGRLSVPYGITIEAALLPKVTIQHASVSQFSGAIRYTVMDLPVAIGLRAHYSKSGFSFTQDQGAFTGKVEFNSDVYGIQAVVSQNFMVIEPYAAIGWAQGKGDLNGSGTGVLGSFGQSASSKASTVDLTAGANLHLGFFNLGAEYSRAFDTNRYLGKLSFGF